MLGNDPLTDTLIHFVTVWHAVEIIAVYCLILGAYLADELGFCDFPCWYSQATLYLFALGSPVFLLLLMVFGFLWGFSC